MQGEPETIHDYLRAHPDLPRTYQPASLADIAEDAKSEEDFLFRVRQFLDDFRRPQPEGARVALIRRPPPRSRDPRWDAFLGALAEHVAVHAGLSAPSWTDQPDRFLRTFWFVHEPAFDAIALALSPAAFRRRGVFISADFLKRV